MKLAHRATFYASICYDYIYIYIYIYILWIKWILTKALAISSLQLYLLQGNKEWYTLSCPWRLSAWPFSVVSAHETFSSPESHFASISWTVFSIQGCRRKIRFSSLVNNFLTKTCFSVQPPNIWWQNSVQTWSSMLELVLFRIASKRIFLQEMNNSFGPISNYADIQKKWKLKKWTRLAFFKKNHHLIYGIIFVYIYIYIYIYNIFQT